MIGLLALLAFVLLLPSLPSMAQDDSNVASDETSELDLFDEDTEETALGWIRLYTTFGVTYLDADGSYGVRLPDRGYVPIIDLETAGLKDEDASYWLTVNWRSESSRWGAWFGSWRYDVSTTQTWEHDFEIPGEDPIPADIEVSTGLDAQWFIVEATYSFYRSETIDTGIGFGFHMVDLDSSISTLGGLGSNVGEILSERLDVLAPLPNVLGYLHWKFAPQWSLVGRVGWFGLDYDRYSGQMVNSHTMLNYDFNPRWAVGFGYQFVDLDLDVERSDYTQVYNVEFSGPMAYLRLNF